MLAAGNKINPTLTTEKKNLPLKPCEQQSSPETPALYLSTSTGDHFMVFSRLFHLRPEHIKSDFLSSQLLLQDSCTDSTDAWATAALSQLKQSLSWHLRENATDYFLKHEDWDGHTMKTSKGGIRDDSCGRSHELTHNCQRTSDGDGERHCSPWGGGLFAWRHREIFQNHDWNWPIELLWV